MRAKRAGSTPTVIPRPPEGGRGISIPRSPTTLRSGSHHQGPGPGASRVGFTLIELMVVVVVMAVMAGAIGPTIASAVGRRGIRAAADNTADLLDFAHAGAIARRQTLTVLVDPSRGLLHVVARRPALPWLSDDEGPVERTLSELKLPGGVEVEVSGPDLAAGDDGATELVFMPDGDMDEASVILTDTKGRSRTIEVAPSVGRVLVQEGAVQ